ncbi:histone-lysine N-methyltransferase SETDB2 [Polymixia lowei]
MEGITSDPQVVARAKSFWAEADVDQVFDQACEYLGHLRYVFKHSTATDREYVQGMNLMTLLESVLRDTTITMPTDPVLQVLIGSEVLSVKRSETDGSQGQPSPKPSGPSSPISPLPYNSPTDPLSPPAVREDLLAPLVPVQTHYQPHSCSLACLPSLTSLPKSIPPFWGQNPLKVPLVCGFQRLNSLTLTSQCAGGAWEGEESASWEEEEAGSEAADRDVVYKTPCGLSLRNHDDVMHFLLSTESYDLLQVDFFSFNPAVRLDPPRPAGPRLPEQDLSRGTEPTPVELCPGEGGTRPPDFKYRKDRWPHGCFLSRGPALFDVCCDCTDGCLDAQSCACIGLTTGGRHYNHQRLTERVPSGMYECGPWCGCEQARCQNRLVQRGLRIRLQVFQTSDRGWGVRCRDDLDQGTFVCMYAGLVLRRAQGLEEAPPPKRVRAEQASDDEVEVVTEWPATPVTEGRSNLLEPSPPASPPLHVPVIQRPADPPHTPQERGDKGPTVENLGNLGPECSSPDRSTDQSRGQERAVTITTEDSAPVIKVVSPEEAESEQSQKRCGAEDVYYLDASQEGNVARFINHSCQPNLFVQNVFTDSHDPRFPVIAFFTSSVLKAGTELTWNYSPDPGSASGQDVPCLCGSDGCQGRLTLEENVCEVCEVEGHAVDQETEDS